MVLRSSAAVTKRSIGGLPAPAGRTSPLATTRLVDSSGTSVPVPVPFMVVGRSAATVVSVAGVVMDVDAVLPECVIEGGLLDSRGSASAGIGEGGGACAASAGIVVGGGGEIRVLCVSIGRGAGSTASGGETIVLSALAGAATGSNFAGLLGFPFTVPTATRWFPSHKQGPSTQPLVPFLSNASLVTWSKSGAIPTSQSRLPPYFLGKSSGSMHSDNRALTSWWPRIKILFTVTGSNHRLIQPQTVGKKEGAPII